MRSEGEIGCLTSHATLFQLYTNVCDGTYLCSWTEEVGPTDGLPSLTRQTKHRHGAKQKQKYRGMFETQKSGDKTSSGDIGLNIRTLASPKVGQDQVSG